MGSRLGWVLAGIFGAFVIIVLVKVILFPSPASATRATLGLGMLTLQRPAEPLTTLLPAAPSAGGNAADDYRLAVKLYQENRAALEKVFEHFEAVARGEYRLTDGDVALLNRVAGHIAAATARKDMTYYSPENMKIPYWPAEAGQFQDLAQVPQMLSVHYVVAGGEAEYPRAEKRLFDMLVMGHHMIEERARLDIVRAGIGLQKIAAELLGQLYAKWKKPDRLKAARDYRRGLRTISGVYTDLYAVIWPPLKRHTGAFGPNPGDVFNLVDNHADRAVRVEAILGLGVVKLTCTSRGDHKKVRALIRKKLNSSDPIEKAAARCADALDQKGLDRLVRGQ